MLKKGLYNVLVYCLIFFIVFFLSAVIFSQVILKGETVIIPDLSGKTLVEARRELAKKDLSLAQKGIKFNDEWERGRIISQDPGPGSRIRVNKVVQVILSGGSERVTVPGLQGMPLESIVPALRDAGLTKGKISQIHTPQYPAGRVIAQKIPPSTVAERGSSVGLLVSQGEKEARYLMPDLIAKRADRVITRLQALDFKIGDIRYAYYPGQDPGIIIKQYPPAGFRVQKRNLITLEVSR